ncbi:hypothetical protein HHL21_20560 [Massilia sp. RP-1-19]|uniref:Uncharacterized protein n=1 Tax=Massilia polaris TaxID=2728846 RepID=A0A848HXE5_9BURK|nr:hypothetical protein [Massilia polaris]NML63438.1 hypothetical protein [Massilia polaris]
MSKIENAPQTGTPPTIHPFHVNVPEVEISELKRRLEATRWLVGIPAHRDQ